jgi:hypothetical protein
MEVALRGPRATELAANAALRSRATWPTSNSARLFSLDCLAKRCFHRPLTLSGRSLQVALRPAHTFWARATQVTAFYTRSKT